MNCNRVVAADECAAAAAAYDCGVEKMPNITKKMVEAGKGSNVEVTLNTIFSENSSKLNLNLLD
jgi:hypothetical protein